MKQLLLIAIFLSNTLSVRSQLMKTDSLLHVLKNSRNETLKVQTLISLSEVNLDYGFHPEAARFAKEALKLATELDYPKGRVDAHNQLCANEYFNSHLSEAFRYGIEALKQAEEIKYVYGQGMACVYLGRISDRRKDKFSAKRYFQNAIHLFESIGSKKGLCYAHNWIGGVFETNENALKEFTIAQKLAYETGNLEMQARTIVNMGVAYRELENYEASDSCYNAGLKLFEDIGNKDRLEWVTSLIAENFYREGKYLQGLYYSRKALEICKAIGRNKVDYDNTLVLSKVFAKLNMFDSAYHYRLLYQAELDSSKNDESMRQIKEIELQYLFDKQKASEKAEQEKKEIRQNLVRNVLIGGLVFVLFFALIFLSQRNKINKEKSKSDALLENILPSKVARELKETGSAKAKNYEAITVMFADIKGFTQISENLSAEELVAEIDFCFKSFDQIISRFNLEKIKTIGDAYMCAGGLPEENNTHARDAVGAAIAIQQFMLEQKKLREKEGKAFFEIRMGIHSGSAIAGVVGLKKFAYDIWGDTVNIASRMEASGEAGKINISKETYDLVKDHFTCIPRGLVEAKGKGPMEMFFVVSTGIEPVSNV